MLKKNWLVVVLCAVIVLAVALAVLVYLLLRPAPAVVNDFDACRDANGMMIETYPEQCTINGSTYTNSVRPQSNSPYIGMTEADALAKAKEDNVLARVVERDGEETPASMDFVQGRHSLYVKDGKVIKVIIEGQGAGADN